MQTIKTALDEAAKQLRSTSASALLDAEILLSQILEKNRTYLRAWPETVLPQELIEEFNLLISIRKQGCPVAYLVRTREFWSREFHVTPDVLIPRPETELLVELALKRIPPHTPCQILDLGTGSGIIAITLATERPQASIIATDISPAALEVAKLNAVRHQVETVIFYQSAWFDDVPSGQFDLILSNPPYLAEHDPHLHSGDLRFEPQHALVAGKTGLEDIANIAENACHRLNPGGYLLLEHGYEQGLSVRNLLVNSGYSNIETFEDLAGLPRVTMGQR